MVCQVVHIPGGGAGWVCSPRQRRRRCQEPGCTAEGVRQCDHPTGNGSKTCDRYICAAHTTSGGPNVDFCPRHVGEENRLRSAQPQPPQGDLFA